MRILVDSSIWIEYFRTGKQWRIVESLIDQNQILTNDLILAELVPFLKIQSQSRLIKLLYSVESTELDIQWDGLIEMQTACLKKGIFKVGLPDLILAQNAVQNRVPIYSADKHFDKISKIISLEIF
jgi:predicted nucleic acid-binding protein